MSTHPQVTVLDLDDMQRGPTAWLFEGGPRAGDSDCPAATVSSLLILAHRQAHVKPLTADACGQKKAPG